MIGSDQRLDSNQRPLLKSAYTDVIISNVQFKGIVKSASFPNSQIYGLFLVRVGVRLRVRVMVREYVTSLFGDLRK